MKISLYMFSTDTMFPLNSFPPQLFVPADWNLWTWRSAVHTRQFHVSTKISVAVLPDPELMDTSQTQSSVFTSQLCPPLLHCGHTTVLWGPPSVGTMAPPLATSEELLCYRITHLDYMKRP